MSWCGKMDPNRHLRVSKKTISMKVGVGCGSQFSRACAGKCTLTDTFKRPSNDIGIKCNLVYVRSHFYRASAGKRYLTDTSKRFKQCAIGNENKLNAESVRSFFSSMCRKVETDTSEKLPNHFKNHLQKSATLRTSSQVSVQLTRPCAGKRYLTDTSKKASKSILFI